MQDFIEIKGARVHNLKNVDLKIPKNKLICFNGPSGSGKTSLAFHTLYTESKRRFLNSFPTYMKFFSDKPAPVDVDSIVPVLPVFGLPQVNPIIGTRSTVSDIMHLTELLQNHFYHYSNEYCPVHKEEYSLRTFEDYLESYVRADDAIYYLFIERDDFIESFAKRPFPTRSLKSKRVKSVGDFNSDDQFWEIARFKKKGLGKLEEKVKEFIDKGMRIFFFSDNEKKVHELDFKKGLYICKHKGCSYQSVGKVSMLNFSPYNAIGACSSCGGFGEILEYDENKLVDRNKSVEDDGVILLTYKRFSGQKEKLMAELKKKKISLKKPIGDLGENFWEILYNGLGKYHGFNAYFKYLEGRRYKMNVRIFIRNIQKAVLCNHCGGTRLNTATQSFFIDENQEMTLHELMNTTVRELYTTMTAHEKSLLHKTKEAKKSFKKIISILKVANDIGLGHVSLKRKAKTVSAGEYQRLLLIKYLSYEGTDSLFVFDEPSLGLSQKEMKSLYKGFCELIKNNNTVIVIDHNDFFLEKADYCVELGPGAGHLGGEIIRAGADKSAYKKKKAMPLKPVVQYKSENHLTIKGIEVYNKSFGNFKMKQWGLTHVLGASGSGKSAVVVNTLAAYLEYQRSGKKLDLENGKFSSISGVPDYSDVIIIDANLNRYTSRSTVGSMTGLFPVIRKHFAKTSQAKAIGITESHLSYHSALGQCPKCEGKGHLVIEMQFLEDVILECEDCHGKKLKSIYADLSDGKFTVHEAFSKPVAEVLEEIKLTPKFQKVFEYLKLLNLDYLSLNRQVNSLSGGEKQRIYLLSKLQKKLENSFIVFENISFGLSHVELEKMCSFLKELVKNNNKIIIIDQNPIFSKIANEKLVFE